MKLFKRIKKDPDKVYCSMKKVRTGRGKLTITVSLHGSKSYICSNCGEQIPCPFDDWKTPNYCPECGAKAING